MANKPILVIIRGPCGSGKSTIAKALAEKHKYALMEYDLFVWDLLPSKNRGAKEYQLVWNNFKSVFENFINEKYNLVIEGSLMGWIDQDPFDLETLEKIAEENGYLVHRIAISLTEEICQTRMEKRGIVPLQKSIEKIRDSAERFEGATRIDGAQTVAQVLSELEDIIKS